MVNYCKLTSGERGTKCPVCGFALLFDLPKPPKVVCGSIPSGASAVARDVRGLGDYTENLLTKLGITKARYVAVKELFGFAPTCACDKRKKWLNKVSEWWQGNSRPANASPAETT